MNKNNELTVRAVIGLIDHLCDDLPRADYLEVLMDIKDSVVERITAEEPDNDD